MTEAEANHDRGETGSWLASASRTGRAEKREDRAHPVVLGIARSETELGEDTRDVRLDGPGTQE